MAAQLESNVLSELPHPFLFSTGAEVLLGHANGAHGQRDQALDKAVRTERELERAASDVHDHGATNAQVEMRERAAKAETRFVLAPENSHLEASLRAHLLEKLLAVAGFPHRARGHDFSAPHAELGRERRHSGQRAERVLNRDLAERTFLVETRAKSGRRFHFVHHADDAGGRNVRNRHADRIRPDVDRRDADVRIVSQLVRAGAAESQIRIRRDAHGSEVVVGAATRNLSHAPR